MISVLYIVHTPAVTGGDLLSLGYFIDHLDRSRFEPIVASIYDSPQVIEFFRRRNLHAFYWPGIAIFPHTTVGGTDRWYTPWGAASLARNLVRFWPSVRATERLIATVAPDIVHVNSLVLSASAIATLRSGKKLLWHVREPVHRGTFGMRRMLLRRMFQQTDDAVFITEFDKEQLAPRGPGTVVHEFVQFDRFDRTIDGGPVRRELGIAEDAKVALFMGGNMRVKGAQVFLRALPRVRKEVPELVAVIPGAVRPWSRSLVARLARAILPLFGAATDRQRFEAILDEFSLRNYVRLLPFRSDPERLMAVADVVVVPFIQPHFAMPIAEAGAMAKPIVASRIGGVEEAVRDGQTGLLVPPCNAPALAAAVVRILKDNALALQLGESGYLLSLAKYRADSNARHIMALYDRIIAKREVPARAT